MALRKKTKKTVTLIAIVSLILLIVSSTFWKRTVLIKYHKLLMMYSWEKIFTVSAYDDSQDDYTVAYEKHRDALVRLGYFERREFPFIHITCPSLQSRRLWEELGKIFSDYPHVSMQGYEPETPDMIVVWDRPQGLSEWETIIAAHDAPPSNIVDIKGKSQDLSAFIGSWGNEDGEICYVITKGDDGKLTVEVPLNDIWMTVIKNLRIEGKTIAFDEFMYTDPSENYKSMIDKSGEHPFSGVRCKTIFEVNPNDPNELIESGTTIHTPVLTKEILRKIK
jgi:hypothetical protein